MFKNNTAKVGASTVIIVLLLMFVAGGGVYIWQTSQDDGDSQNETTTGNTTSEKKEKTEDTKEDTSKDEKESIPTETPSEVVEKFMNYTLGTLPNSDIDYDAARELMTDDLAAENSGDYFVPNFYGIQDGPDSAKVTMENVSGDSASVKVDAYYGEMATAWAFVLVKEDNKWLISEFRNDAQ